jgi:hypothetical protein
MPRNAIQNRPTDSKIISEGADDFPIGPDVSELSKLQSGLSSTASINRCTVNTDRSEWKKNPAFKNMANTYSAKTQQYLIRNPINLDALKHLSSDQLRDCRDAFTGKIARIPVFLDNNLFDLQTLLNCLEGNNVRKDPVNKQEFFLCDIKPAEAIYSKIQERIKIEEKAQEEKYSMQARTIIADAERARKQQRAKCVVL